MEKEKSFEECKEKLLQSIGEFMEAVNRFQKALNDAHWYLGEEKSKNAGLQQKIVTLEERVKELERECDCLRKARDEANWYLGEERARREGLEKRT
ncbi:MAG: hypothetical protein NC927_00625 [Candidatus Omnitrophica bacterium]|nr:hypothetical protein [Candidatus Omnitrophota bacterium]